MVSQFSPPIVYLTDDDDDNEPEQNISYGSSLTSITNENLPRKKRRLTNTNVRINPSIVNWSKRQRNDHYQHQPITHYSTHHEPETIFMNPDEYNLRDQQSHSFHAFDWTTEPQAPHRIYSNPIQTASRVSTMPPTNMMNVVKHHLGQLDTGPSIPLSRQNDRYIQHPQRKSLNMPISATPPPPLALPLPTPTSSLIRPHAQRIQPGKDTRIPYAHATPPQSILPVLHKTKPVFPSTTYYPPSSTSISTPVLTTEIRRQALNGTGILSAFYDSKTYRCNICKYKNLSSATLLQHLFTHIFFCHQCVFYSYSHHDLYQHLFEKHNSNRNNDTIDPRNLDLLYVTRCSDGTFALCMDSSPSPPPPPPPLPPPTATATATKTDEKIIVSSDKNKKSKPPRKKAPKPKKEQDNDIVILSEKRDINPKPSSSSSSSAITKRPILKEKPTNTYVLMKHRRCYSILCPPCLHSLTLEYNICREHTIRHMCHTQGIFKRQKFKLKLDKLILIDEIAKCLKTVVNHVVDIEENRDSSDLIYALPNNILNLIFPTDNLNQITNLLKLNNKYDKSIEKNEQNQLESSVRTSNQHTFILSSSGINKNEQSIFASLHTLTTDADSVFTSTKLEKLPISCDNTDRFLKGNLNSLPRPTNSTSKVIKKSDLVKQLIQSTNSEPIPTAITQSLRNTNRSSTSPIVDKNNNSVASSKSRLSPTPSVIILD